MKAETITWEKLELTKPVEFKEENLYFSISTLKNHRGRVMAEVKRGGEKLMRPFDYLPENVQQEIQKRITATA